jgi:serine/threonine-protein kinase
MPLSPGTRLGPYEIVAPLGAGGMGEVFRARDTKLARDVALKLLPEALGEDKDRLARFRREAQVLASLNHPHIAAIYGLEEADGKLALVLELVEGEGLDARLRRGAIPVDEALAIARQMALGLEAAHEKGVIHRDLKPANVQLASDGNVKLLDFGLAKAYEGDTAASEDVSQSPTLSRRMTEAGLILGTAAYMSPEQARGKKVDKRADVWAFGVVLFEMLTGRKLFDGETVSDTLAAVLRQDVDWAQLPTSTPACVRRLLRHCLERDPKQRLHDIGDARLELEEAKAEPAGGGELHPKTRTSWLPWLVAAALGVALAVALIRGRVGESQAPITRLKVEIASSDSFPPLWGPNVVLSPDGRTLVFAAGDETQGRRSLFVRPLGADKAVALSGTEGAHSPFFSPDGRQVAFFAQGNLMRVPVEGGAPVKIGGGITATGRGGTWSESGEIVFTPAFDQPLFRVSAEGGTPTPVTSLNAASEERSHRWPAALPGGKAVLFMTQRIGQDYDDADIEAAVVPSGERKLLVRGGAAPRYATGGRLLYLRQGVLFAAGFDARRLELTSPGRPVLDGVLSWTGDQEAGDGSAELSLSATGTLVYRPSPHQEQTRKAHFAWVGPDGKESPAFDEDLRVLGGFELSPDGKKLVFEARSSRGMGLYIRDFERGGTTPFTAEGSADRNPVWSADGRRVAYAARPQGAERVVRIRTLDGSAPERQIPSAYGASGPTSWSPDGSTLLVDDFSSDGAFDVYALPLEEGAKPRVIARSPQLDAGGRISPNGRFVVYVSSETGPNQVYATALAGGPRWQVSTETGAQARWSRDGRRIFFTSRNQLFAVTVEERGAELRFGSPRLAYAGRTSGAPERPSYDVHPDGRLLVSKLDDPSEGPSVDQRHVVIVFNWLRELEQRMREAP